MTEYQQSIENSFKLLTGQATLETICMALTFQFKGEDVPEEFPIFFLEPDAKPDEEQINAMIDYIDNPLNFIYPSLPPVFPSYF